MPPSIPPGMAGAACRARIDLEIRGAEQPIGRQAGRGGLGHRDSLIEGNAKHDWPLLARPKLDVKHPAHLHARHPYPVSLTYPGGSLHEHLIVVQSPAKVKAGHPQRRDDEECQCHNHEKARSYCAAIFHWPVIQRR